MELNLSDFYSEQELQEFFEACIEESPVNPDFDPDGFDAYFNKRLDEWLANDEKKKWEEWVLENRGKTLSALVFCLDHGDAFFMGIDPLEEYTLCPECGGDTDLILVDSYDEVVSRMRREYSSPGMRRVLRDRWKGPSEHPPGLYVTRSGKTYFKMCQGECPENS